MYANVNMELGRDRHLVTCARAAFAFHRTFTFGTLDSCIKSCSPYNGLELMAQPLYRRHYERPPVARFWLSGDNARIEPTMAMILKLPDELLLQIGRNLYGRGRNSDLRSLSFVCRRFCAITQENLICAPSFHLRHIDTFMWELAHRPNLVPKIKSMEIRSSPYLDKEGKESRVPHLTNEADLSRAVFNINRIHFPPHAEYPALGCPLHVIF